MNNQSYISCELNNIKFAGLEAFTINIFKTQVPAVKNITKAAFVEAVNGSIGVENITQPPVVGAVDKSHESEVITKTSEDDFDQVLQVKFKSSNIAVVPNEIFHKFQSLQIFDASHSNVKNLNTLTFNNAAHLHSIFLQNNQLTSIGSYVFVHTKQLEVLDLANNKISHIEQLAFNSLTNLKRLSLSNNRIKSIEEYTFRPLKSLKWIWLENNEITMISSETFTAENHELHGILAKNNAIESISPFVLDNLASLRFLDLSGNKCSGQTFKNHAIKDNASIKFELRGCHENHRKLKLSSDRKHGMYFKVNSVVTSFEQCAADVANITASIDFLESQFQVMRNLLKTEA